MAPSAGGPQRRGAARRLVRELAAGVNAAVVFPEYDRSPEASYPVAIEQSYAIAQWVWTEGESKGLNQSRIAIAGDSVGGNMTSALILMAKERGAPEFAARCSSTRSRTRTSTLPPTTSSLKAIFCAATQCATTASGCAQCRSVGVSVIACNGVLSVDGGAG